MIEGVDDEQQRLVVVDLEGLVDRPLELDRMTLHGRGVDAVFNFPERAQQTASVDA